MTSHDHLNPFHNINIANKCNVEWRLMKGQGAVRRCPECLLNVYDLNSVSQEEARKLFEEHENSPCMELYRRVDGMYMARNCPDTIWRVMFGPSQNEIWRQLSDEIDARLIGHADGDYLSRSAIKTSHGPWIITLDTYTRSQGKSSVEMTRLRSPFVNAGGLQFTIYPTGFMSDFGKLFGMQDITIGDSHFDDQMIIQGNIEARVRRLLSSDKIRELLLWLCRTNPSFVFTVKDDERWFAEKFPDGVDELYFESVGLITDRKILKRLVELFAETLDQLGRIGVAGAEKPGFDV